tara:strand:+ start:289 stop:633 length:345 start_codon:yes stop_codon:yes gene_type:complete
LPPPKYPVLGDVLKIVVLGVGVGGVGKLGCVLAPVPARAYLDELKLAPGIRVCVSSEYDNLSTRLLLLGLPPQKYPDERLPVDPILFLLPLAKLLDAGKRAFVSVENVSFSVLL